MASTGITLLCLFYFQVAQVSPGISQALDGVYQGHHHDSRQHVVTMQPEPLQIQQQQQYQQQQAMGASVVSEEETSRQGPRLAACVGKLFAVKVKDVLSSRTEDRLVHLQGLPEWLLYHEKEDQLTGVPTPQHLGQASYFTLTLSCPSPPGGDTPATCQSENHVITMTVQDSLDEPVEIVSPVSAASHSLPTTDLSSPGSHGSGQAVTYSVSSSLGGGDNVPGSKKSELSSGEQSSEQSISDHSGNIDGRSDSASYGHSNANKDSSQPVGYGNTVVSYSANEGRLRDDRSSSSNAAVYKKTETNLSDAGNTDTATSAAGLSSSAAMALTLNQSTSASQPASLPMPPLKENGDPQSGATILHPQGSSKPQCGHHYVASLVLCPTPGELSASRRVELIYKAADFLSIPATSLTWLTSTNERLHFLYKGYRLESGGAAAGASDDSSNCSTGNGFNDSNSNSELFWPLSCSAARHVDEFTRILQHNVMVGRIREEIGADVLGWYVASKEPKLGHRRRKRRVGHRTPIPTPSLYPTSATAEPSSSSSLHVVMEFTSSRDLVPSSTGIFVAVEPTPSAVHHHPTSSTTTVDFVDDHTSSVSSLSSSDVMLTRSYGRDMHSPSLVQPSVMESSEHVFSSLPAMSETMTPPLPSVVLSKQKGSTVLSPTMTAYSSHREPSVSSVHLVPSSSPVAFDSRSTAPQQTDMMQSSVFLHQTSVIQTAPVWTSLPLQPTLSQVQALSQQMVTPVSSSSVPTALPVMPAYADDLSHVITDLPASVDSIMDSESSRELTETRKIVSDFPGTRSVVDQLSRTTVSEMYSLPSSSVHGTEPVSRSHVVLMPSPSSSQTYSITAVEASIGIDLHPSPSVSLEGLSSRSSLPLPHQPVASSISVRTSAESTPLLSFPIYPSIATSSYAAFPSSAFVTLPTKVLPSPVSPTAYGMAATVQTGVLAAPTGSIVIESSSVAEAVHKSSMSPHAGIHPSGTLPSIDTTASPSQHSSVSSLESSSSFAAGVKDSSVSSVAIVSAGVHTTAGPGVATASSIQPSDTPTLTSAAATVGIITGTSSLVSSSVMSLASVSIGTESISSTTVMYTTTESSPATMSTTSTSTSPPTTTETITSTEPSTTTTTTTMTSTTTTVPTTQATTLTTGWWWMTSSSTPTSTQTDRQPVTTAQIVIDAPNNPPFLVNALSYMTAALGCYFEKQIPSDMFYDVEDGSTRFLSLIVTLSYDQALPSNFWVQFDQNTQTLMGLPLVADLDMGYHSVVVVATDSKGLGARNPINLYVNSSAFVNFSHRFILKFGVDFGQFMRRRDNVMNLLKNLASYFGDDSADYVTVVDVSTGSFVLTWTNSSLSGTTCQNDTIHALLNRMVRRDGSIRSAFNRHIGKKLKLMEITYQPDGACLHRHPPPLTSAPILTTLSGDDSERGQSSASESDLLTEVILPVLIALLLVLLLVIVGLFIYRCRQQRGVMKTLDKELYVSDRSPVILPSEMPAVEPYNSRPKKPIVMPYESQEKHTSSFPRNRPRTYEHYRQSGSLSRNRPNSYTFDDERPNTRPVTVIFNNFDSIPRRSRPPSYWNDHNEETPPNIRVPPPYISTTSV